MEIIMIGVFSRISNAEKKRVWVYGILALDLILDNTDSLGLRKSMFWLTFFILKNVGEQNHKI